MKKVKQSKSVAVKHPRTPTLEALLTEIDEMEPHLGLELRNALLARFGPSIG